MITHVLLQVDSVNKLSKVVQGRVTSSGLPPQPPRVAAGVDVNCVLVQYPESGQSSAEEELVAHHCKSTVCSNDNFDQTIALPD